MLILGPHELSIMNRDLQSREIEERIRAEAEKLFTAFQSAGCKMMLFQTNPRDRELAAKSPPYLWGEWQGVNGSADSLSAFHARNIDLRGQGGQRTTMALNLEKPFADQWP